MSELTQKVQFIAKIKEYRDERELTFNDLDIYFLEIKDRKASPRSLPNIVRHEPIVVVCENDIKAMQEELKSLRSFKAGVDEALNSGNGTYKP